MTGHKRYRQTVTVEAWPLFDLITETRDQLQGKAVLVPRHPDLGEALPAEVVELPVAERRGSRRRAR